MWRRPLVIACLTCALAALVSVSVVDLCAAAPVGAARVEGAGSARGALRAGAALVALTPPYPITVAGYAPLRSTAAGARRALFARAVVLQVGALTVGLVAVDLLTVPEPLAQAVRAWAQERGLAEVWVSATHAHSSFGGYDRGLLSELAGTGTFREEAEAAVVAGATSALAEALKRLAPATLSIAEGLEDALVLPRTGNQIDARLTRVALEGPQGAIAQLVFFSAHPTLVERRVLALDPDYPGAWAAAEEAQGGGVTLVLMASGGNASAREGVGPEPFAARLLAARRALAGAPVEQPLELAFCRVRTPLPPVDCSRLLPHLLARAGDNLLCRLAPREASLSALKVGPLQLLALPGEPTAPVGHALEERTGARRTVGLTNGYLGYIEEAALVRMEDGEAQRQYFAASLETTLQRAASLAAREAHFQAPPVP